MDELDYSFRYYVSMQYVCEKGKGGKGGAYLTATTYLLGRTLAIHTTSELPHSQPTLPHTSHITQPT